VDALSSTVPRGKTPAEDKRLENELLKSDKQRREHKAVIDGIKNDLTPLCSAPATIGKTSALKLAAVQHLLTPITGILRSDVSDADLINALHPTPATAGMPKSPAMDLVTRLEGFDRGWYAAPIGFISRDETELAVGIRSAVIRGEFVSVFSGAGIVRGSDPDDEYREIESKDILQQPIEGGCA